VTADGRLRDVIDRVEALRQDHVRIASEAQSSRSRAASVEVTLRNIQALSGRQAELLKEAALAASYGLYRPAHVAGFAALVDGLHQRVDRLGQLGGVAAVRPKWKLGSVDDLQEYSDFQVGDACKEAGVITRNQAKSFHGLLHRRNQCAHPTGYSPSLDETLGFLTESLNLIDAWAK
jgi:hypothetical protein